MRRASAPKRQHPSATGLELSEAKEALRVLELQVLVKREKDRLYLSDHLRELMQGGEGDDAVPGP